MIRQVKISDAVAIQEINTSQLNYNYPLNETKNNLEKLLLHPEQYILLAETTADDKLIGYVHAEVYLETFSQPLLNVLALAVSSDYQGHGIGKNMMAELANIAPKFNARGIRLNSGNEREDAHEFYKRIGYIYTKDQKRFFLKL